LFLPGQRNWVSRGRRRRLLPICETNTFKQESNKEKKNGGAKLANHFQPRWQLKVDSSAG
jgi:hypothetical protein